PSVPPAPPPPWRRGGGGPPGPGPRAPPPQIHAATHLETRRPHPRPRRAHRPHPPPRRIRPRLLLTTPLRSAHTVIPPALSGAEGTGEPAQFAGSEWRDPGNQLSPTAFDENSKTPA